MLTHQDIGHISGVLYAFKNRLAEAFAQRGLAFAPTQLKVLRLVSHMSPCTAQALAQTLGRDKAQVTRLLQDLVNTGVLERVPNPDDKRSQLLHLTAEGESLYQQMLEAEQEVLESISKSISQSDAVAFSQLLERVATALKTS